MISNGYTTNDHALSDGHGTILTSGELYCDELKFDSEDVEYTVTRRYFCLYIIVTKNMGNESKQGIVKKQSLEDKEPYMNL